MIKLSKVAQSTMTTGFTIFHSLTGKASELKTVPHVNLKKYMGDWNVIAYIPNTIEKNCVRSIESYALRADGKIDNWFVCNKSKGKQLKLTALAWVENTKTNAEWRVRFNLDTFFGKIPIPLHFSYFIIDLDPDDYSYTAVGHPSRSLLWIMSKNKSIDEKTYQNILYRIKNQGYDISKIVKLPQASHR